MSRHPDDRFVSDYLQLRERVRRLEQANPEVVVVYGPRSDAAADVEGGEGPRLRLGVLSDGTYGVERWTEAGARQVATFS